MVDRVPFEATMEAYGDLRTDRRAYRPLDTVIVRITGRGRREDTSCRIVACDGRLRQYCEAQVDLDGGRGEVAFLAAGSLGVQWIYLYFPDSDRHSRYANFLVDCETSVETGHPSFDDLYPATKEALQLNRRTFDTAAGPFVGYISGDTWRIHGVWLRDWIYQLPAYGSWEQQLTCGLDRFLENQREDGSVPDGIERDGRTWRMGVESDVEYIFVLGVYDTWRMTGDDGWLAKAIPHLERALEYVRNDPRRWDAEHGLVKRGHTCDTWDFEINETSEFVGDRAVIATCDQSGYYLAYLAMAEMHAALGDAVRAGYYRSFAEDYRRRANELLWDGVKYLHHVHLTPIDHPGFDEPDQLAMGNVWALTRDLADHEQAVSVLDEYRRRHAATGDAYPWWSLQPGYPDSLGYYEGAYCKQGGYANGGLMPWVGGELCRACFDHGREDYGLELYRQYVDHLRRTGNSVHVWYWPDGRPGFRTTNEVPHTGWGMAEWLRALLEGIGGVRDKGALMRDMVVSPRWAAVEAQGGVEARAAGAIGGMSGMTAVGPAGATSVTGLTGAECAVDARSQVGVRSARVSVRYAVNDSYFCYRLEINEAAKSLTLAWAGSGETVKFRILLPHGWKPEGVFSNGAACGYEQEVIAQSHYIVFSGRVDGLGEARVLCSSDRQA